MRSEREIRGLVDDPDECDECLCSEPPDVEVEDTPNPVVAQLLGPDGVVVSVLHERPVIVLGLAARPKPASRIVRLGE